MILAGRRVLIVGLGASGQAAVRLARAHGAEVAVSDAGDSPALRARLDELASLITQFELGGHTDSLVGWADLIVASPGVPLAQPAFKKAQQRGTEIIGEVELAASILDVPLIAITGTNGKSTTTSLVGEMFWAAGRAAFVGGNLGTPLAEAALTDSRPELAVVELSSFQIETIREMRPWIAALLNLSPDHQNRYASFDDYVAAKWRLFAKQGPDDIAVLGANDRLVMAHAADLAARRFTFGTPDANASWTADELTLRGPEFDDRLSLAQFRLPGEHNKANLAAAALVARLAGVEAPHIERVIAEYAGLPHRLEFLGENDGVLYFNDSKATTPDAVATALQAMDRPVVLILGGRDKGGSWHDLLPQVDARACAVIAYGEAGPVIAAAFGARPVQVVGPFVEALDVAQATARPGQAVLLSPGCASYDQFANFAERGETMRAWGMWS